MLNQRSSKKVRRRGEFLLINFLFRKSADELLKNCKSFFSKAKGKEYIKEKLFAGLKTLESRVKNIIFSEKQTKCVQG